MRCLLVLNTISLEVGDWSHDGHNMSDKFYIKTPYSAKQIEEAYKKGTELIGFDLKERFSRYESGQASLPEEDWPVFKRIMDASPYLLDGYEWELDYADFYNTESLDPETYFYAYLGLCRLGDENFGYEVVKTKLENWLGIGGYGCYS